MRRLFHHSLSPGSRAVRLLLEEADLDYELVPEKPWERRTEFLKMNPAGNVPVLVDERSATLPQGQQEMGLDAQAAPAFDGMEPVGPLTPITIVGERNIVEYVDEIYRAEEGASSFLGDDAARRAETRRLIDWFTIKFYTEVSELIVGEKIIKRLGKIGTPDTVILRAGLANISYHLDYIGWLMERRKWLAGDSFTAADICAAAQLSTIDYVGDVAWEKHPGARDWYARVKSRKTFRKLLADHISGLPPARHYADLDF